MFGKFYCVFSFTAVYILVMGHRMEKANRLSIGISCLTDAIQQLYNRLTTFLLLYNHVN